MAEIGHSALQAEPKASVAASSYAEKPGRYFSGVRQDFLQLLREYGARHVLEIGCGLGETGAVALANGLCDSFCGIELSPEAASTARSKLSEVLEGDVEKMAFPWPDRHFDAVLMSEVLEHLIDPWAVVSRVSEKLRPGALVMASSPNVAQMDILRGIVADRWELTESGIMDSTHLRWFTQHSYRDMFEKAGIRVQTIGPLSPPGPISQLFNIITLGRLRHLTMRQINLIGFRE